MDNDAGETAFSTDQRHQYFPTFAFVAGLLIGLIGGGSACGHIMIRSNVFKLKIQKLAHVSPTAADSYMIKSSFAKRSSETMSSLKFTRMLDLEVLNGMGEIIGSSRKDFGPAFLHIPGPTFQVGVSGDINSSTTPLTIIASY